MLERASFLGLLWMTLMCGGAYAQTDTTIMSYWPNGQPSVMRVFEVISFHDTEADTTYTYEELKGILFFDADGRPSTLENQFRHNRKAYNFRRGIEQDNHRLKEAALEQEKGLLVNPEGIDWLLRDSSGIRVTLHLDISDSVSYAKKDTLIDYQTYQILVYDEKGSVIGALRSEAFTIYFYNLEQAQEEELLDLSIVSNIEEELAQLITEGMLSLFNATGKGLSKLSRAGIQLRNRMIYSLFRVLVENQHQ